MQMRIILNRFKDNGPRAFAPVRNIARLTKSAASADALLPYHAAAPAGPCHHAQVKRLRVSMGTLIAIEAAASSSDIATKAVEAAFAAVAEVERHMHPHSADSDVARINRTPMGVSVQVHTSTCELLEFAHQLNALTDGVFDPCLPTQPGGLQDIEVGAARVVCSER